MPPLEFTVGTWNIGGAHTVRSPEIFDYDRIDHEYFLGKLAFLKPDILCMQEVPVETDGDEGNSFIAKVEERLGMHSNIIVCHDNHIYPDPTSKLAIATFSRLPLSELETVLMPYPTFGLFFADGRPAVRHDKYLQITEISTDAGPLIVTTTHNQSMTYAHAADGRKLSYDREEGALYAAEVDAFLCRTLAPYKDRPSVLAADLNADNAAQSFPTTFAKLQLKEALADAGPTRANGKHTDYLLHNSRITVHDAGIIQTAQADHHLCWNKLSVRHS
jgi:endonuclease/exonuclease/phosphatase family protein